MRYLPEGQLANRFLRATGWIVSEHGIGQMLRFAGNLVLTRLLAPDMFGVMAIAHVVISGMTMFSDIGLELNVIRSKRGNDPVFLDTVWTIQILRGLLLFLVTLCCSLGLYWLSSRDFWPSDSVYQNTELPIIISLLALSPLIDVAANRFNNELQLEDKDKIDFKIKAKQFVKVYGQMASIMPFEVLAWEKLFWFIKFLIPKLKIQDPNQDALDELLEAVDLSSYGLERTKLNHAIGLDASESELEPQNPNPRGYREGEVQEDPLEEIVRSFNERWFQGWSATPEEQRVKFLNIVDSVQAHPDYDEKFSDNPDPFSRDLAFEKIMKDVMLRRRKEELELYKLHSQDPSFKASLYQSIKEMLRNSTQRG